MGTGLLQLEGGVAGHMSHLYDNPALSFAEMKKILKAAAGGELLGTEKTDGVNLFLSYDLKSGESKAARNRTNIQQGGLDAAGLAAKFAGRGSLETAFTDAFDSWNKAISMMDKKTKRAVFGPNADIWYNAEVQTPDNPNVVSYDTQNVVIHTAGHAKFNKKTGELDTTDVSKNHKLLQTFLNTVAKKELGTGNFRVVNNAVKKLRALDDQYPLEIALGEIDAYLERWNVGDGATVGELIFRSVGQKLDKAVPGLPDEAKDLILKRIIGEKVHLNKIKEIVQDRETLNAIKEFIKKGGWYKKEVVIDLELIIHEFAVEMLEGLESAFILDNDKEVQRLKDQVSKAIELIKKSGEENAIQHLERQLRKLQDIEKISTATEGFVFDFNGVTYKFTGNFAPVNQILGLFKFGRPGIPAIKDLVKEESGQRNIVIFPGGFKPPHVGHFVNARDFLNLQSIDEVHVLINTDTRTSADGRVEINPEQSLKIWEIYVKRTSRITPEIATANSLIKSIYEKIASMKKGSKVFLTSGEKDVYDVKKASPLSQDSLQAFSDKHNLGLTIQVVSSPVPKDIENISASMLRELIADNNEQKFYSYLPEHLSDKEKMEVWNIARGGVMVKKQEELEETSAMAGGSVEGYPGPLDKKRKPTIFREEAFVNRNDMLDEFILREAVRDTIRESLRQKNILLRENLESEIATKQLIRKMILKEQEDPEDTPHASTGINVLEDLLKKIIPQVETGYKVLTTKEEQRKSFRAHILKAVQNTLTQADITSMASPEVQELAESVVQYLDRLDVMDEADIDITVNSDEPVSDEEKDEKFIDIEPEKSDNEEEVDTFSITGEDETGRNMAQETFDSIENQIIDAYAVLSDPEDKKVFYDYLLTNLKLYFDKFEDEIEPSPAEPIGGAEPEGDEFGGDELGGEDELEL